MLYYLRPQEGTVGTMTFKGLYSTAEKLLALNKQNTMIVEYCTHLTTV